MCSRTVLPNDHGINALSLLKKSIVNSSYDVIPFPADALKYLISHCPYDHCIKLFHNLSKIAENTLYTGVISRGAQEGGAIIHC